MMSGKKWGLVVLVGVLLFSCVSTPEPVEDETGEPEIVLEFPLRDLPEDLEEILAGLLQQIRHEHLLFSPEVGLSLVLDFDDFSLQPTDLLAAVEGLKVMDPAYQKVAQFHGYFTQTIGGQEFQLQGIWNLDVSALIVQNQYVTWPLRLAQVHSADRGAFIQGFLPDFPGQLSGSLYLSGIDQEIHDLNKQEIQLSTSWQEEIQPLIVPLAFQGSPVGELPEPFQIHSDRFLTFFLPGAYGYSRVTSESLDEGMVRLHTPQDRDFFQNFLRTPGALHLRAPDSSGFFLPTDPASAWYLIDGQRTASTGYGTTLPLRAKILWETPLASVPVLGADRYEVLSGGNVLFGDSFRVEPVQRSEQPFFSQPGFDSAVFSALRGGRVLLEVAYEFELFNELPPMIEVETQNFSGRVMEFSLTNRQAVPLLEHLISQDHGRIVQTANRLDLIDTLNGTRLAGFGSLDYGNQFGLVFENNRIMIRGERADHPIVGVSWIGTGRLAWVLSVLQGKEERILPPRITGVFDEEDNRWRLPSSQEWAGFSQTRAGFRPARETVNYFRSFDPFEDPNPPHTREGGPTNPAATFGPDSIFGLYGTRGNVWEWTQDLVAGREIPEIATGPLDGQRVYRRVLGGAWNTPLSSFGPRGLEVPQGWFAEDQTSWSIGIRYVIPGFIDGESSPELMP